MNENTAIIVQNVTKTFRMKSHSNSLKSAVLDRLLGRAGKADVLNALDDISFTVKKGETLGIIGANGAGKSTLLSLITGISKPSKGTIETKGTISSLLELGAGFHPELTGRENIFLYGAIMGISREQMKERFDAIVEFAGISKFIDQPVKHYSSGMYVRLGFAVAVEVDPDILLIDEVLAVGDINFQKKCIQKMEDFRKRQKTMLIISHDINTIRSISDRILHLDAGKIIGLGDPTEITDAYQSISRKSASRAVEREWGTGEARIAGVVFKNDSGKEADSYKMGEPVLITISYETKHRINTPVFGFSISDSNGKTVYGNNTQIEKFNIDSIDGKGTVSLKIDGLAMATGIYHFSFSLHSSDHTVNYHRLDNKYAINVEAGKSFEGVYMPCIWNT